MLWRALLTLYYLTSSTYRVPGWDKDATIPQRDRTQESDSGNLSGNTAAVVDWRNQAVGTVRDVLFYGSPGPIRRLGALLAIIAVITWGLTYLYMQVKA